MGILGRNFLGFYEHNRDMPDSDKHVVAVYISTLADSIPYLDNSKVRAQLSPAKSTREVGSAEIKFEHILGLGLVTSRQLNPIQKRNKYETATG